MKTITEFSGNLIRQAAEAYKPPPAAEAAPPPAEAPPPPAEGETPAEPAPAEAPAAEAATPAADPQVEQLGAALGVTGDRLARLVDALAIVGDRASGVRRVVVCGPENPPPQAKQRGDFFYVIDWVPQPAKAGRPERDDRGGRGDRRGGPGGDRRGGPGGDRPRGPRKPGDQPRFEREPPRGEVPAMGAGWMLSRAPGDPGDKRGDRRGPRGGRGRPGGGRGRPPPKK